MIGFILAAGFGTRLRPLTNHMPKALVPLAGKPLLEHALMFLEDTGITTIGVNTHYRAEDVATFREKSGIDFTLFHEIPEIRGTGGALEFAREFLSQSDTFIVANADIIARFNLEHQIHRFIESNDICRLLAFPSYRSPGTIYYEKDSYRFLGTTQKIQSAASVNGADFIGITLYRSAFLSYLNSDDFSVVPVWDRVRDAGEHISVSVIDEGYWKDLGTPEKLAEAYFNCIDGMLPLKQPGYLFSDSVKRICRPKKWSETLAGKLSHSCWIECDIPIGENNLENCVVLRSASGAISEVHSNYFYSKWGGIKLNE